MSSIRSFTAQDRSGCGEALPLGELRGQHVAAWQRPGGATRGTDLWAMRRKDGGSPCKKRWESCHLSELFYTEESLTSVNLG